MTWIEKWLVQVLGDTYGGPSISYDHRRKLFVLYKWYDAPVDMEELATGPTLKALLENYQSRGDERK